MGKFHYLDHTADLGVEITGDTLEDLLITTARAIFSYQIDGTIEKNRSFSLDFLSDSFEDLVIDWCREILYLFSVHGFIPCSYKITIQNMHVKALLHGDVMDLKRHAIKSEIKNATYHDLLVKKKSDGYHARIVFDV